MVKSKIIKVSSGFDQEIRRINRQLNDYIMNQGILRQITLKETIDMVFPNNIMIKPEDIISKRRKGKFIKFSGEMEL